MVSLFGRGFDSRQLHSKKHGYQSHTRAYWTIYCSVCPRSLYLWRSVLAVPELNKDV